MSAVIELRGVERSYVLPRASLFGSSRRLHAVNGVDLVVEAGRSFGLVGESGCGKSTLARLIMGLEAPSAGAVRILGEDLARLSAASLRALRAHFQMVFQDPYGSLDPRHRVGRIVGEPLWVQSVADKARRVGDALEAVGLKARDAEKYPHEFSGGQRQRIAIARALVTRPRLIVADEPVSALDVSVQAQVLNLMLDLQRDFGLTYLLISHDLAVVEYVCADVGVMYAGRIVEQGPAAAILGSPLHPYSRALADSVPAVEPRLPGAPAPKRLPGSVSRIVGERELCLFADRCALTEPRCRRERPPLSGRSSPEHRVACHCV